LSEDAEALAGAPGTTLQVEPFHSSINVSKPSPLAATRVWPTAQAWVWEAAKVAFNWEKVLPAGLGLLSTCHVPAASAGDAAISAAAAPPATAISARRIFTDSPLLALAALCTCEPASEDTSRMLLIVQISGCDRRHNSAGGTDHLP
jgi:hypothetical protein